MGLGDRARRAWNTFLSRDPTEEIHIPGPAYSYRPDRPRLMRGHDKSIVTSMLVRMSLDVAANEFRHCKLNDDGYYTEDIDSGLNDCLTLAANMDQTHRAFIQDAAMTILDKGCAVLVPVDTTADPNLTNAYDILTMRVGEVVEWKPAHVKIRVYDDQSGLKKEVWVPKNTVAIIENPMYSIINEPNSTIQRLMRKLSLLDVTDEQTASGKLDLIIQVPYSVKNASKQELAEKRRVALEAQLRDSTYGVAYMDGTEKITQLNRPVENNLMKQVEFLTAQAFAQLGMTQSILDGTADEQTMLNYYSRSIEPLVGAIVAEMKRTFLSKTARTQKQSIEAFRDPFKLVPVAKIAEIGDTFTRNKILTANEMRQIIGRKPSKDPDADKLKNSNISDSKQPGAGNPTSGKVQAPPNNKEGENQNGS